MSYCSDCKNNGTQICSVCCSYQGCPDRWEAKPKTNADRIRNMTDEELAIFFRDNVACGDCPALDMRKCGKLFPKCYTTALEWLKQEAE